MELLIDADVLIEALLNRRTSLVNEAEMLWDLLSNHKVKGYITSVGLDRIYSILKLLNPDEAIEIVANLESFLEICDEDISVITMARQLPMQDFDSALEVACALTKGIGAIITLIPRNFRGSTLHVLSIKSLIDRWRVETSLLTSSSTIVFSGESLSEVLDIATLEQIFERSEELQTAYKNSFSSRNFSYRDLRQCNFQYSDLSSSNLSFSQISDCNLQGIHLRRSKIAGSDLARSNLSFATLTWSDFTCANLNQSLLIETNSEYAKFDKADLSFAKLNRSKMTGAYLIGSNLMSASLNDAILCHAFLQEADLRYASLVRAKLQGVSLRNSKLSNADLRGAKMNCANLSNADLSGADLSEADLRGANLSYCDLSGANLSGTIFTPEISTPLGCF
jgi:uncharacterized protein YjbI with pentapeptide repeats/predicted nucleic acid-binding protein